MSGTLVLMVPIPLKNIKRAINDHVKLFELFSLNEKLSTMIKIKTLKEEEISTLKSKFINLFREKNVMYLDEFLDFHDYLQCRYHIGLFNNYFFEELWGDWTFKNALWYIMDKFHVYDLPYKIYDIKIDIKDRRNFSIYFVPYSEIQKRGYHYINKHLEKWKSKNPKDPLIQPVQEFFNSLWGSEYDLFYQLSS
ncbi:MAG: hypothetical protein QW379_00155 [Thermoplasmata archaeon]